MKIKKGQIRIQQMAFMLLAVTLFFSLVGLFFLKLSLGNLKGEFISIQEENAKEIVNILASSPEFSCSNPFPRSQCIDMDRAIVMKNRKEYTNFWEVDNIIIRKTYSKSNKDVECSKGNYPNCNVLNVYSSGKRVLSSPKSTFVSLCYREYKNKDVVSHCDFGTISVAFKENGGVG